ncbi:MAG: glycosyltransferase family 4 protein [Gemmatimonadaceae bacterium]
MNHLFVTQDFGPDLGGMARRHVELARRFSNATESMSVSTVHLDGDVTFDAGEDYTVDRQPFHFREANRFANQLRWAKSLTDSARDQIDVMHCGNIRPVGYAVSLAARRLRVPYIVYVNGGDLLREREKSSSSPFKRRTSRHILGNAAGIAATSAWVAELTREVMTQVAVEPLPPIAELGLGTDPLQFAPDKDTGRLRSKWNVADCPLMLTVARLVPHKGQDTAIRALAALRQSVPDLRYVMVGEGHYEPALRELATELGVADAVVFAGALAETELPEAYATSTVYVGPSRVDNVINAEGYGISFLEAASSGLPVVAGDSGGVRSAVRDGETGIVLPPEDVERWAQVLLGLLNDDGHRKTLGLAGRLAVESYYNWDRVARDTRRFTLDVVADKVRAS